MLRWSWHIEGDRGTGVKGFVIMLIGGILLYAAATGKGLDLVTSALTGIVPTHPPPGSGTPPSVPTTPPPGNTPTTCPVGYTWVEGQGCKPDPANPAPPSMTPCQPGYHMDLRNGLCYADNCPPGKTWHNLGSIGYCA
jgi:hypothetical protein